MNVKSATKENGIVTFVVEVEKAELDKALDKAYRAAKSKIYVPGFRKGKAPRKVIEGMYGSQVFYEDAINEMFPDLYSDVLKENAEIKVVGMPSITDMKPEAGGLILTIANDLYPEVTLGQYKGLEVEKAAVEVTDADVDAEIAQMAERNARIVSVERPAQDGDTVVIDFEGFKDGVPFDGGKDENFSLKLGSGTFIPGFEEQLVGAAVGEEREVNVTFPEDYHAAELAGAAVVFRCKVHEIKETILPELDDEFVKDVSEFDTMEELRADLKAKQLEKKTNEADSAFQQACLEKAVENMTCEVPASMIDEQLERVNEQYSYQLQMSGLTVDSYAQMMGTTAEGVRTSLRPIAERQTREMILMNAVCEAEGLEVTEEDMTAEYERFAGEYKMDTDKVKAFLPENEVRMSLKVNKAMDFLTANAVAVAPTDKTPTETEKKPAAKKTAAKKAGEAEKKPAKKTAAKKAGEAEKKPAKKTTAKKAADGEAKPAEKKTTTKKAAAPKAEKKEEE